MIPSRVPFLFLPFLFLLPVDSIRPPAANAAGLSVSFQTVAKGSRSGIDEAVQIVIRNQPDWTNLWRRHTALDTNPPPSPAIDFTKELVAAVFLGRKPTGGYAVEIVSVERSNDQLTVSFRETTPRPGGITTQALIQPFHIVSIGLQGNPEVRFRRAP